MALDEYNRKRDFTATPEPDGENGTRKRRKARALQYCIQKHDATRLHYDFRLELDGTLKSWAVPKGPSLDPKSRRLAVHVEDHPLEYATFEGSIPKGHYGAGDVIVWDRGVWIPEGDPQEGYRKGKLKFSLEGEKLSGTWNLVRTRMDGGKEQWFLIKSNDDAARPESEYNIVEELPDSVLSDRTLIPRKRGKAKPAAAAKAVKTPARRRSRKDAPNATLTGAKQAPLPESFKPQLATLVESVPDGDWRYEIKFDGYRIMARIESGRVQLFTRNGHDWTQKMPQQAEALAGLGLESAWLDGEVVVPDDDGTPDFQALQNAFEAGRSGSILYYLFDMPYLNGMDLREVPLEERRAALSQVLDADESELLRFSADFTEQPESMLESACQMKLEGLIGKRAGSTYVSRRSNSWVKIKCKNRQEFVIVGYTDPKGTRSGFGALLLGLHDEQGQLLYAGKVGTGFNHATLESLHAKLKPLGVDKSPLAKAPPAADVRGAHWLKPELICEVAYAEMTRQGVVRHSVFHGLRSDKPAKAITHERPAKTAKASSPDKPKQRNPASNTAGGKIKISNPERIIDKTIGATKMELARFYAEVAPWALPHLAQRPLALVRAPEGIDGELFFQKHTEKLSIPHITQLDTALFPNHAALMTIDTAEALISAAQMGTIELHTWNAVAPVLDHPDRFVLDLDPDPALPWKRMVEATQLTQTLLDELGLQSYLKTSGGKGLHVMVPLEPVHSWTEVKAFSQAIAQYMAKLMPQHFSAVSGPKNRIGKIFIDYLRNSKGASTVAAYSVRAREGLAVSVPIHRDELADLKGANIWTIRNLMPRLEEQGEDPWAGIDEAGQQITAEMRERLGMK
ncbi:DNA ligase D [Pseudomonas sp. Choline-3u-10]|jgi:bifunctional non-homologous end joining protein LigD|uniref:DNA ligase D n=3 Tax=Pseudomonadales TaxID=72274 RepID=UPI000617E1F4|nr:MULTISPECIES: DNA ligase D [Pseudomonadaceae]MAL34864.1 ATP-dependent DNA ligase [Pseudomonas sp.]KJJ65101.1 ATP-dependent DNA ligase [Pseudomonas sp. 10B238]MBK3795710.1 DNA ligase D [Stutzerimonas stutzeri]MBK3877935.1 DNA ligase D [Stutzerimonas stutzeri]PKG92509.1 DNA ligase D [Pseudomonas sp. Choline-3u-10]